MWVSSFKWLGINCFICSVLESQHLSYQTVFLCVTATEWNSQFSWNSLCFAVMTSSGLTAVISCCAETCVRTLFLVHVPYLWFARWCVSQSFQLKCNNVSLEAICSEMFLTLFVHVRQVISALTVQSRKVHRQLSLEYESQCVTPER